MGGRVRQSAPYGILLLILIFGLLLRMRGMMNPLLDDQGWRQADTASMAWHMLGRLTDIPEVWFPTLSYDGPVPQKAELEFPFLPYLLAWTWTLLGWSDFWGRLWSVIFSMVTIGGVFVLGKSCFSERVGLWAAAIYAFVPLTVYYGRVVMPEPVAQACSVWALIAAHGMRHKQGWLRCIGAGIIMALAVLAKLPQLMIFPVGILIGFWPLKTKGKEVLTYTLAALLAPMLYYGWVHEGASQTNLFVSGIMTGQVVEGARVFGEELWNYLREEIGISLIMLTGAGSVTLAVKLSRWQGSSRDPAKEGAYLGFMLWCIISIGYILFVCLRISLDYYLVPVVLPFALLAGIALEQIEDTPGFVVGILMLYLLLLHSTFGIEEKYRWDERYLSQALWLREATPPGSILILSDPPPMTFYYARRVGYRLNSTNDGESWQNLRGIAGDYFVALPHTTHGEKFWEQVRTHFPEVAPGIFQIIRS